MTYCVTPSSFHFHSPSMKKLGSLCRFAEHLPVKSKLLIFVNLLTPADFGSVSCLRVNELFLPFPCSSFPLIVSHVPHQSPCACLRVCQNKLAPSLAPSSQGPHFRTILLSLPEGLMAYFCGLCALQSWPTPSHTTFWPWCIVLPSS